ncbi:hypothetical protein MMC13_004331 [Lambiella insularis]|nr:hypothetical protein [Lambiella insularis]
MHHTKGLTLSVRNLPLETTKRDIEGYFNGVVHGAQPHVGSIVGDSQDDVLCATVTLNSEETRKKALKDVNGLTVWAPRGMDPASSEWTKTYLGITRSQNTIAQTLSTYYFLHGLGGHAFETFAAPTKKHKPAEQKMWARDLLPERFLKAGLHGRYSTLGYKCKRGPWYHLIVPDFVIRDFNGLVVSQALILADNDEAELAGRVNLRGLVKGNVFMGTPFWGSFTANALNPFVSALDRVNPFPVNSGLVRDLKANSGELAGLITKPDSAAASLKEWGLPIAIHANHVGMVKFGSSADPNFRTVSECLVRLTQKHIGGGGVIRSQTMDTRPPSYISHRQSTSSTSSGENGMQSLSDGIAQLRASPIKSSSKDHHRPWSPPRQSRSATQPLNQSSPFSPAHRSPQSYFPIQSNAPSLASQQYGNLQVSPAVLPMPEFTTVSGPENMRNLTRLSDWDIVFMIDDTNSMDTAADSVAAALTDQRVTTRWDVLVRGMQYIANTAAKYDEDGVDVYSFCSKINMRNVKDGQQILNQLMKVNLEANTGGTYFERTLSPILSSYIQKYTAYHEARKTNQDVKPPTPMNIIVLTDGAADDGLQTEKLIVRVAQELDEMWAPSFQLGIQFVQVGDDPKATKYLEMLDNRLEQKWRIRDMVDTTQFVFAETGIGLGDKILKILLGAMDKALDNDTGEEEEEDPYAAL